MKAPLEMPSRVSMQQFELQRVDYGAPEASGRVGGVQAGFPLWMGVWTLPRMPVENSDEWRAWLLQLRGATRRFLGRDHARPYPKQYPDGFAVFSPWTGNASSWSETITADDDSELTLNGLPAGLILSVGDYVGFKWNATETAIAGLPWRALVRVVEGGTANGSGTVTVTVEPPVPTAVPGSATAHLDSPACVMAIMLDQTNLEAIDVLKSIRGGTITAIQDLRA